MKSFITIVFFLLIAGVGIYFLNTQLNEATEEIEETSTSSVQKPITLPQAEPPKIQHPIAEPIVAIDSSTDSIIENQAEEIPQIAEVEEPLPTMEQSDNVVKKVLLDILGSDTLVSLFKQTGIIHRFVITVDTLPQRKLANKFRLTEPVSGKFLVQKDPSENITLDPKNADRYQLYMQIINLIETDQFVKTYTHYYPLIQEAYDALGYKERYFNDRFIEVIDHLLGTPEIDEPISLVQPKVFYEYADPGLESLSAGQKILLRIGKDNRDIVKAKLIAIRNGLASPQLDE